MVQEAFCFGAVHASILYTVCGNFTKFTTSLQLETKMNWLDF